MKKIKQLLVIAGIFIFVGSFTAQAQTGTNVKDAVKKEQKNLDQKKDKVKDKAKDKAKDKMKEKQDDASAAVKDKTDQIKGDAAGYSDAKNDKIKILEDKLKKARTDKERQEIKKMIEQEMKTAKKDAGGKVDDAKDDFTTNVNDAKNDAIDKADAVSKGGNDAAVSNDNVVVKATELGRAKRDGAKAKLAEKEKDLEDKEELVRRGRARIASAKERLAAAIANGDLTEDQIKEKQGRIDRAEAGIDKLEGSITGGKAAYARQKASLSKLYDNQ